MPSLDEMRAELRELKRKAGSAISKLKKEDVQRQLEMYRGLTQENEATPTKKKHGRTLPSREMVAETVKHGNLEIKMPKMSITTKKGKEALAKTKPAGGAGESAPVKRKKIVEVEVTDSESEEEIVVKRKPGKKVVYVESDGDSEE
jgi:hypothetical protein